MQGLSNVLLCLKYVLSQGALRPWNISTGLIIFFFKPIKQNITSAILHLKSLQESLWLNLHGLTILRQFETFSMYLVADSP